MSSPDYQSKESTARSGPRVVCEALLETATTDLYQKNSFRILGLAVDATVREISRQAVRVKQMQQLGLGIEISAAFPLKPAPSQDDIRAAIQRLQDPEKRIVDEFFWFWPEEFGTSDGDTALQAIVAGDTATAIHLWKLREAEPKDGGIAQHNLAVLWHLTAVESELNHAWPQPGEDWQDRVNGLWKDALGRWEQLSRHEVFWEKFRNRILQFDDPRLTSGLAYRFRKSFPQSIARINGHIALRYAEAGNLQRAESHSRFMRESVGGLQNAEEAARWVLASAASRLKELIIAAQRCSASQPARGADTAEELVSQANHLLPAFALICAEGSRFRDDLFDEVAEACNRIQLAYDRETQDEQRCVGILNQVLLFTTLPLLRTTIENNIRILTQRFYDRHPQAHLGANGGIGQTGQYNPHRPIGSVLLKYFGEARLEAVIDGLTALRDATDLPEMKLTTVKMLWQSKLACALSELPADQETHRVLSDAAFTLIRKISLQADLGAKDLSTALAANELALQFARTSEMVDLLFADRERFSSGPQASNDQAKGLPRDSKSAPPVIRTVTESPEERRARVLRKHFGQDSFHTVIGKLARLQAGKDLPSRKLAAVNTIWLARVQCVLAELEGVPNTSGELSSAMAKLLRTISLEAYDSYADLETAKTANQMAFQFAKGREFWRLLQQDRDKFRRANQKSGNISIPTRISFGVVASLLLLMGNHFRNNQSDSKRLNTPSQRAPYYQIPDSQAVRTPLISARPVPLTDGPSLRSINRHVEPRTNSNPLTNTDNRDEPQPRR